MTNKTKSILFVVVELILLFVTGLGAIISSESDFWSDSMQEVLPWIGGISLALFIGGIYWYSNSRKKW